MHWQEPIYPRPTDLRAILTWIRVQLHSAGDSQVYSTETAAIGKVIWEGIKEVLEDILLWIKYISLCILYNLNCMLCTLDTYLQSFD